MLQFELLLGTEPPATMHSNDYLSGCLLGLGFIFIYI